MTEDMVITLVRKAQNGDMRAFEQLVEQYYPRIYNIALGIMGTQDMAEDASQNALIKMYRSVGSFKFQSKFSTWVYRITTNVCMDELRKNKRKASVSMEDLNQGGVDIKDTAETPEDSLIADERGQILHRGIASLKSDHKQIIVLRDINGFSYSEIAEILKCSEGTVKSRISRAREALKNILISSGYFNG